MTDIQSNVLQAFNTWYGGLKAMKRYGGRPAKGIVAAALVVLERLRQDCRLDISAHLAEGGAQIAGLNLSALKPILTRFREERPFPSEGGRTNRGNNHPIQQMLQSLYEAGFANLPEPNRYELIDRLQKQLVQSLDAYYTLERISFSFDPTKPARVLIGDILENAKNRGQSGPVAQHLVGAKLAIRFPDIAVDNFPSSAADDPAGRSGDFLVGRTVFHITVAPNMRLLQRCQENLRQALSCILLVPEQKLPAVRALLETERLESRVAAESLESFIGQNVSELAKFVPEGLIRQFAALLDMYNRRVRQAETDMSLLITVPASLEMHKEQSHGYRDS